MAEVEPPVTRSKKYRDSLELYLSHRYNQQNIYNPNLDSDEDEDHNESVVMEDPEEVHRKQAGYLLDTCPESDIEDTLKDIRYHGIESSEDVIDQIKNNTEELSYSCILKVVVVFLFAYIAYLMHGRGGVNSTSYSIEYQLDDHFSRIKFISPEKRKEIQNNILMKYEADKDSSPLAIFLLITSDDKVKNVSRFSETLVHTYNKYKTNSLFDHIVIDRHSILWEDSYKVFDNKLNQILKQGTKSVVIYDFCDLKWDKVKLFFKFCDNENAPFQDILYVFTSKGKCNLDKPDKSVEDLMIDTWSGETDIESIEALAARVSAISVCI